MIAASLLGTGSALPGVARTTAELVEQAGLPANAEDIEARTGIRSRRWAGPGETIGGLAAGAVRAALADAGMRGEELRRLILTNSTGGDVIIPATANAVLQELGLADSIGAFDLNNGCMGFLTGFDLAARLVATGSGPVAVIGVEVLSRFLSPTNPRPYVVLADAAAAAILGPGGQDEGILATAFGNNGAHRGAVAMAHPGLTGREEQIVFAASNKRISEVSISSVLRCTEAALDAARMSISDVDWIVPHQPNGSMLQKMISRLGAPADRVVPVVQELGSVGSASIAVGLDALRRTRDVAPGQRILMVGVGAGLSYGALVFQVGT